MIQARFPHLLAFILAYRNPLLQYTLVNFLLNPLTRPGATL